MMRLYCQSRPHIQHSRTTNPNSPAPETILFIQDVSNLISCILDPALSFRHIGGLVNWLSLCDVGRDVRTNPTKRVK